MFLGSMAMVFLLVMLMAEKRPPTMLLGSMVRDYFVMFLEKPLVMAEKAMLLGSMANYFAKVPSPVGRGRWGGGRATLRLKRLSAMLLGSMARASFVMFLAMFLGSMAGNFVMILAMLLGSLGLEPWALGFGPWALCLEP